MAHNLTDRQHRVIETIRSWIVEHGVPPTIRELGRSLGIKSLRGVTTHLDALSKKGYLLRRRGARSLRLLGGHGVPASVHVPILGRIAAGQPILAQEHREGALTMNAEWLGSVAATEHFALQVHGRSMIGAGILDGDYVIVRQQPEAQPGEIVAALIGEEATVKRFAKSGDAIRLEPANPAMDPIVVDENCPARILGKVVAVFRRLA